MIDRLKRATLFALYQFSITAGILMLPVAVALARVGVVLPIHRVVDSIGAALEDARASGR